MIAFPVGQALVALCSAIPSLRSLFASAGVTPSQFGQRAVPVQIPGRAEHLLFTGVGNHHLTFQLFWRGMNYYEPFTRTTIEAIAGTSDWFIDVGANIGLFSLVAARVNPTLKVVAFEPNPDMFARLSAHQQLNDLSNLAPEPIALSNQDGEATLFLTTSPMSASLVPEFQHEINPAVRSVAVKTVTLDSYVERAGISGSVLVKVDVEGHDKAFFEGAVKTIRTLKPDLIVEVLNEYEPARLQCLRELGYRFYKITNQGLVETPVVNLTRIGDFTFFNYLFSTRPPAVLESISQWIKILAPTIDLYQTSKYATHLNSNT